LLIDFTNFKKTQKACPILLFNEADAIIGKRKSTDSSSVADSENAIQNVLLEELENFDGILFATSNLVANLDSAFERRFSIQSKI
jgi:SpoVK/Ycf46/Vps4 family AAA+-type ATPase